MSRLYPGWGSGNKPYECELVVNSVACVGREDIEAGDKVILPQSAFRDISRLRLPFPLVFKVDNPRIKKPTTMKARNGRTQGGVPKVTGARKIVHQEKQVPKTGANAPQPPPAKRQHYCGLMEFSAPEKTAYFPFWLMKSLKLREGSKVKLCSILDSDIPKGISCKLQPHTGKFLDVAASMDLRVLLEESFRNYSVLSKGSTIVVSIAGQSFSVNVVETSPADAISLYGNLDLEVDFAPPLDSNLGKIRPSKSKPFVESEEASQDAKPQDEENVSNQSPHVLSESSLHPTGAMTATVPTSASSKTSGPIENDNSTCKTPEEHRWGEGRSLKSSHPPNTKNIIMPERKPSKYSTRSTASSFSGNGKSLNDASVTQGSSASRTTSMAIPNGSSGGRMLSDSDSTSGTLETVEDVRARRLAFFESMQKKATSVA